MKAILAAILSIMIVLTGSVMGQMLDRGQIEGIINDESGAVLPGVSVVLTENSTGFSRTVISGDIGQYRGVLLPLGTYTIRAELQGFAAYVSASVELRVGQLVTVNITMRVAGSSQVVEVSAAAENAGEGVDSVIGSKSIVDLPINGRDYRDFAQLSPTAQTITGTRGTFRLGGQPGDYTQLNLDGADFTNNFFGEFFGSIEIEGFTVPQESVQEFEVNAGGFGTEFGRSNGGMVNVVTKSGSNSWHGSAVYLFRDASLTADDAFGNPPEDLSRHQFGGSLGGPISADRTFFFVAADFQQQSVPLTIQFNQNVSGIAVPELGIADLGALEGQFSRERDIATLLGKIDHSFSQNFRLTNRVNYTRNDGTNIAGGTTILSRSIENLETFKNEGISSVTTASAVLSPRTFLEAKFQIARETRPREPQGTGPQVIIGGVGTIGKSSVLPTTQDMNRFQGSFNVTRVQGRHDVSFGADFNNFNMRNNFFAFANTGQYTFPNLQAFIDRNLGPPANFLQSFGVGVSLEEAAKLKSYWQKEIGIYFQDKIRVHPDVQATVGLRYDAQFNPSPEYGTAGNMVPVGPPTAGAQRLAPVPQDIPNDTNNTAARFGLAWNIGGGDSSVVRLGAGFYYGRTPMIYFPVRGSGIVNTTIFVFAPAFVGLKFPDVFPDQLDPGSTLFGRIPTPNIQYVDPDFQNPRVFNLNLSFSQSLGRDWISEFSYLLSESKNLRVGGFRNNLWDRNFSRPTDFDAFGRGINLLAGGRPDTSINRAEALGSFGHGRYQAFVLKLTKRFSDRYQFFINYTFSDNKGNGSTERDTETSYGPSDPFNLELDYGTNELDLTHAVKSGFIFDLPGGVSLSSTIVANSGLAYPVFSSTDLNGDRISNAGRHPDRPVSGNELLPRFPFHQPSNFTWDFRFAKRFSFSDSASASFIAEVFNLFNNENTFADAGQGAVLGSANFRVNNRTLGPRLAQLGLRLDF